MRNVWGGDRSSSSSTVKASKQNNNQSIRGQIGQIAQHRAQAKQRGSDVTAEQGSVGRKTRGEGSRRRRREETRIWQGHGNGRKKAGLTSGAR